MGQISNKQKKLLLTIFLIVDNLQLSFVVGGKTIFDLGDCNRIREGPVQEFADARFLHELAPGPTDQFAEAIVTVNNWKVFD